MIDPILPPRQMAAYRGLVRISQRQQIARREAGWRIRLGGSHPRRSKRTSADELRPGKLKGPGQASFECESSESVGFRAGVGKSRVQRHSGNSRTRGMHRGPCSIPEIAGAEKSKPAAVPRLTAKPVDRVGAVLFLLK